jgi:hypothetical protein
VGGFGFAAGPYVRDSQSTWYGKTGRGGRSCVWACGAVIGVFAVFGGALR